MTNCTVSERAGSCVKLVTRFCAVGSPVLVASPAFASDPTGTVSFLYTFGMVLPWAVISLVVTAIHAGRGGYRSFRKARLHAVIGGAVPLTGLAVTGFDFFVVRRASTPWPGIETVLICAGLCLLAGLVGLSPLLVHARARRRPD